MKRKLVPIAALLAAHSRPGDLAQKKYDRARRREIRIGNTNPTAAGLGLRTIGKTITAYFKMIDDRAAINGRKLNFIFVRLAQEETRKFVCTSYHVPVSRLFRRTK